MYGENLSEPVSLMIDRLFGPEVNFCSEEVGTVKSYAVHCWLLLESFGAKVSCVFRLSEYTSFKSEITSSYENIDAFESVSNTRHFGYRSSMSWT